MFLYQKKWWNPSTWGKEAVPEKSEAESRRALAEAIKLVPALADSLNKISLKLAFKNMPLSKLPDSFVNPIGEDNMNALEKILKQLQKGGYNVKDITVKDAAALARS